MALNISRFLRLLIVVSIILQALSVSVQGQKIVQFSGYIKNDEALSVPFAHVYARNNTRGTICDFWGYFSLAVASYDTMVFSSVGYKQTILVIPDTLSSDYFYREIIMLRDTILLAETIIYPWHNYEQFKQAFMKLEIPEDDYARANRNFAIMKQQMISEEQIIDASLNYKYLMQEQYRQLYYVGQTQPISLLNVMAWGQFFEALKNGDFKRKKEIEPVWDY